MSKGKEPTLTKTMVEPEDAGTYRCQLGTVKSSPATVIHFHVKVLPKRIMEETQSSNITTQSQVAPEELTRGPTKSPTTPPSPSLQSPTVEKTMRSLLVGLLTWGFVVLIASIAIL